jgi:hypothetical protein
MNSQQAKILKISKRLERKYKNDFSGWVRDYISFTGLCLKDLTNQQTEIADFLIKDKNICVSAGGGIGKTALAALSVLWFLSTHPHSKVPTTAPTAKQLNDVLWSEISLWLNRCKIRDIFVSRKGKIHIKHFPEWYAVARTVPRDGKNLNDTLAGFHAPHLMILVDEACLDEETEILTNFGWKGIDEIDYSQQVLTKNSEGESYYKDISKIHKYDYKGEMYNYYSSTLNFCISPNHNVAYRKRNPKKKCLTELRKEKIKNFDITKKTPIYFDRKVNFTGDNTPYHVIKELKSERKTFSEKYIDMITWTSFMGWFISEGYITNKGYGIGITQKNEENKSNICAIIEKMGFNYNVYKNDIIISSLQLAKELECVGKGAVNKSIPLYIKNLDKKYLYYFLATFMLGDGYRKTEDRIIFYTSSKQLADDLQEVSIKCGYSASLYNRNMKGRVSWIGDHYAVTKHECYYVGVNIGEQQNAKIRKENIYKSDYDGRIWCVSVPPEELIYVRRRGQCHWTGNSGVPDPVFTALEGAMTDENSHIFLISNPVSSGGYYYDTITDPEGKGSSYRVLYYDSRESELVDDSYAERIIERYGKDSPMYIAKVLGKPVSADKGAVVTPDRFDAVVKENKETLDGAIVMGIDVGGGGNDPTVFCHRKGMSFPRWDELATGDPDAIVDYAISLYFRLWPNANFTCVIDAGGLGWGPYNTLKKKAPFRVLPFIGSEHAIERNMFRNKRTEGYYTIYKEFESLHFPTSPPAPLKKELANLFIDMTAEPMEMEPKRKMIARIGSSPNYADAMMMSLYSGSLMAMSSNPQVPVKTARAMSKLKLPDRKTKFGQFKKFIV